MQVSSCPSWAALDLLSAHCGPQPPREREGASALWFMQCPGCSQNHSQTSLDCLRLELGPSAGAPRDSTPRLMLPRFSPSSAPSGHSLVLERHLQSESERLGPVSVLQRKKEVGTEGTRC